MNRPRLTFDDGPADDTQRLLDLLARHRTLATFFLIGQRVEARNELARRIAAEGHAIGNHSWSHPDLTTLARDALRSELERTSDAIERVVGARPALFRPPYGFFNDQVQEVASALGMRMLLWDVDTADYERPGVDSIAAAIEAASADAVVLMHDGRAGDEHADRSQTVAAVARVLGRWEREPRT
jgi:peptidoglycan-N-acetylglucosamine deacetylase